MSRLEITDQVILDEPDVYLHADLQRKLIRMAKRSRRPTIVATHSLEIISEVEPDNIIVIEFWRETVDSTADLHAKEA